MYLSENKIKYVFHHLWNHLSLSSFDPNEIVILKTPYQPGSGIKNKLIFPLSPDESPHPIEVHFHGQQLPVLFALGKEGDLVYRADPDGNIIFSHDLLSSAFYLLSGQQETETDKKDQYGRYPYDLSIQKQLDIAHLPLVNYYFEMIMEGIEAYAKSKNKQVQRRRLFKNFGFFLSHDVDRVAYYHPLYILYRIKQFLGLAPSNYSKSKIIKLFFQGIFYHLNPNGREDPWWNFDWMMKIEKELGIRSAFYFLKQEDRFDNSLYQYHHKKIKHLITTLNDEGFEVGLHGTMRTATDGKRLLQQKNEFIQSTNLQPKGIRQHYLRFSIPQTFKHQMAAGFRYDTSLTFAERDGFRNGYCWPFHPYDFESDEMMDIWEIPLVMMEVSALNYRQTGFSGLQKAAEQHIQEAQRFGGIFSLLWHNCRLNDIEVPGVSAFYKLLLKSIIEKKAEPMRGIDICDRMDGWEQESSQSTFLEMK